MELTVLHKKSTRFAKRQSCFKDAGVIGISIGLAQGIIFSCRTDDCWNAIIGPENDAWLK